MDGQKKINLLRAIEVIKFERYKKQTSMLWLMKKKKETTSKSHPPDPLFLLIAMSNAFFLFLNKAEKKKVQKERQINNAKQMAEETE